MLQVRAGSRSGTLWDSLVVPETCALRAAAGRLATKQKRKHQEPSSLGDEYKVPRMRAHFHRSRGKGVGMAMPQRHPTHLISRVGPGSAEGPLPFLRTGKIRNLSSNLKMSSSACQTHRETRVELHFSKMALRGQILMLFSQSISFDTFCIRIARNSQQKSCLDRRAYTALHLKQKNEQLSRISAPFPWPRRPQPEHWQLFWRTPGPVENHWNAKMRNSLNIYRVVGSRRRPIAYRSPFRFVKHA